jgi:hypothetical protein
MRSLRCIPILFSLLLSGCAPKVVIPFVEPPPTPFSIETRPEIALVYVPIKIICNLPRDVGDGAYRFGVAENFMSGGPIDRLQVSKEIVVPCEPFTVFCAYQEYDPIKGAKDIVSITKTVEPVGECK